MRPVLSRMGFSSKPELDNFEALNARAKKLSHCNFEAVETWKTFP